MLFCSSSCTWISFRRKCAETKCSLLTVNHHLKNLTALCDGTYMCHMFECHINSSRTKRSLLTGCVSRDVVYLLKASVLSRLSRVSRSTSISLSPEPRSSFALAASPSLNPEARRLRGMAARERESEGWLSLRNINYSLEIRSHTRCWFLGFSLNRIATLSSVLASAPMTADTLSHVHTLFMLFLSVPRGLTWQPDTSH